MNIPDANTSAKWYDSIPKPIADYGTKLLVHLAYLAAIAIAIRYFSATPESIPAPPTIIQVTPMVVNPDGVTMSPLKVERKSP